MNPQFTYFNNTLYVGLSGDVDEHASRTLRSRIDDEISSARPKIVVLDFSKVGFVDSTGLGLIFGRYKKLAGMGAELVVANVPALVDKVFRASGVYSVCPKIQR